MVRSPADEAVPCLQPGDLRVANPSLTLTIFSDAFASMALTVSSKDFSSAPRMSSLISVSTCPIVLLVLGPVQHKVVPALSGLHPHGRPGKLLWLSPLCGGLSCRVGCTNSGVCSDCTWISSKCSLVSWAVLASASVLYGQSLNRHFISALAK